MKIIKDSINSDKYIALLLLIPGLIGLTGFYIIPLIVSFYYSFIDNIFTKNFVFIDNYIKIFGNKSFLLATKNTIIFLCMAIPLQLIISFVLANMINVSIKRKNLIVSYFALPLVLPIGCFYFISQLLFAQEGMAVKLLSFLGINETGLLTSDFAIFVVLLMYLWRYSGFTIVLYLSALQFLPKELYECAEIDGASSFAKMRNLTIPILTPVSFSAFLIAFSNSLRVFKEVYTLGGNYPQKGIYMLQHYINNSFVDLSYSKLSATTVTIVVCVTIILALWSKIDKRLNGELL